MNRDALALELIPDVGAHRIVDFIDSGVIAHIEFDFVDHSEIGKIDEKYLYLRFRQDALRRGSGSEQRIFYATGWVLVLNSNANPHGMDFGRVMEIDDGMAHHLVVRDVEIDGVVGAQSCRTPVDLHHLGKALAYL